MSTDKVIVFRQVGSEDLLQDPTEARKALEAIDIRLTNKPITLLQHKIYNVWVAFAQSTINASETRVFEFPLSEVMELCGFDSNNHAYFIDAAREMLDLRVEYNSMGRQRALPAEEPARKGRRTARPAVKWAAAQLVSFIEIDSAANLMRIEFPEILRKEILRPDFYRTIDLRKQRLFTSRAGLTLYEYVLRFAADQATPWLPWESYSMLLSGAAEAHKTFREFSKMLQRAMEQVNAHHDSHHVHAEFTKRGRAIEKMRIVITLRHQSQLAFDVPVEAPPADLVRALGALGLSQREAENVAGAHPRPYLEAQIAYVRRRLGDRDRSTVKVPAAYLRAAIAGNYAGHVDRLPGAAVIALPQRAGAAKPVDAPQAPTVGTPPAAAAPRRSPGRDASVRAADGHRPDAPARPAVRIVDALPQAVTEAAATSPYASVRAWYAELSEERRAELSQTFLSVATPIVRKALELKGMGSPVAASAFYSWLRNGPDYPGQ